MKRTVEVIKNMQAVRKSAKEMLKTSTHKRDCTNEVLLYKSKGDDDECLIATTTKKVMRMTLKLQTQYVQRRS